MYDLLSAGLSALTWAAVAYFVASGAFYTLLLASAALELRLHRRRTRGEARERVLSSAVAPRVSVLAPAHDEGFTVAESVRALLTLSYPALEVVVVNDGSRDDTLAVLQREFDLVAIHPVHQRRVASAPIRGLYRSRLTPELVVVDKDNGGKADALNAGLNVATGELVCAIDADTLIEPDALLRMVRPFLHGDDVVAAGGTIRVANGSGVQGGRVVAPRAPRTPLGGIQAVEYLRAFLFGRLGWNRLGGNLIISGAFGLFRREGVIRVGGYLHETVGEDMELVARLRRAGAEAGTAWRVEFVPDPVAWTEVPESLGALGRQRDRWHRGLADVLWRYRGTLLRPRYGALGMVAMPSFVVFELMAPVVEAIGLVAIVLGAATGTVDASLVALFFLVSYGYGLVLAGLTLVLEQFTANRYERLSDRLVMIGWAALESLGYRQLTVVWRLRGLVGYARGNSDWGAMARRGFAAPADAAVAPVAPGAQVARPSGRQES